MHVPWAKELTEAEIRRTVGVGAFLRGQSYWRQGRVGALEPGPEEGTVVASVLGSGDAGYRTTAGITEDGEYFGDCTCPMVADCKHVAAVLLAVRDGVPAPRTAASVPVADWERSLADLRQPEEDAAAGFVPLGLLVEVVQSPVAARWRAVPGDGPRRRVRLRPVVPGKTGNWVRGNVSWRSLAYGYPPRVRAHAEVLTELYGAHQARSQSMYSYGDQPVTLDDFGPAVWPLLQQVLDAGVPLVPAKGAGPVALAGEPADVRVDLGRDPTGDVLLRPEVVVAGSTRPASSVLLLGDPAHGVAVEDPGGERGLLLAPLARRTTSGASRLLSGGPVRVPARDVERFLRDFTPRLRRVLPVTSSDGSVQVPEPTPPRLALGVTHEPGPRLHLAWSFAYTVGDAERRVPLDDPDDGLRDLAAERSLLEAVPRDAVRYLAVERLRGVDAVLFLDQVVPVLRGAGVEVSVSGEAPEYRLSESAPAIAVSASDRPGDTDWFDLGVTVSVDGEEVPFQPLFSALARGDSHLVLASGTYFPLDRPELEQLRRLIEEAKGLQEKESDGLRISRYQAGLWEELVEVGVVQAQSERWAASVAGLLAAGGPEPAPVPDSLAAELRPYQLDGYRWLSFLWDHQLGGVLADDMGLGKTVQTLAAACRAFEQGRLTEPLLVVAPTSVVSNWAREAARFAPKLDVATVTETDRRRGTPLADHVAGAHLVVTSYALFRIDHASYDALAWSGLVLDEAQAVKNHQAKTYQCARRLEAPVKIAITGTPLENSLMDLWSMLSIVAPGLFPTPQRFEEVYRRPIERDRDAERLEALRRRIRPLMRRRTKEQVAADLPPKQEQVLEVVLNPRHRTVYDRHLQRERQKVLGLLGDLDKNRFAIFRSLTVLRQLSLDPSLVDDAYAGIRPSKVDAFLEHLDEVVSEGHRALVFSQFTGFLRTVRERLDAEGVEYVYLDGRTRDRQARIETFKTGAAPVFLISLKAGGVGLNLTEADYVFVLDPWWNPAVEAQAVDRTHRIGQDKHVMVYRLVAAGTIEEKVMELKARKADLFSRVMDDGGHLSSGLTAEDIAGLLGA